MEPNPDPPGRATLSMSGSPSGAGARAPIVPGRVIKHYEILRELGHGGMGGVFLARDLRLARLCAIKLLFDHAGASAGELLAEARATACCKHDSIVTLYEVDEIDGCPYMVLEYLEGDTLRAWMTVRAPVSPRRAAELMIPVVRALRYAHELGIVHRDLKPENILLTSAGPIKVLDFGIARRIDAADDDDARPARIGTPPYMAPEQWSGGELTPQSDLWAVGIILHELVTGAHPLAPASLAQLIEVQDLEVAMPSLAQRHPELGPLGAVIDRCLQKPRAERIDSARALLAELASVAGAAPAHPRRRIVALVAGGLALGGALYAVDPLDRVAGARHSSGTAIIDLPLPPSRSPEARAAYDAALHGFRDANWTTAEDQLRRAVALDPTMAAAHLRLAILRHYTAGRVLDARQSYALAVQWRAALSARDRDILDAFEPLFSREPAELAGFTARLAALARRRPDDAEVLALVAYFAAEGPEVQLRAARHAIEVDPEYADGWQAIGKQLFALGRTAEALRAFDGCLIVSPSAVDCRGERAQVHAALGQCAAAEADLRHASAANPQGRYWRDLWASSLLAQGKPVEAAIEVLAGKWDAEPADRRALVELQDRARLDLLGGRFDQARAGAIALQARTGLLPDADLHARYATLRIDIALEADQRDEAAAVADDYLRRREAWVGADIDTEELAMLTVLRDAGRLSAEAFDARRVAWLARHRDLVRSMPNEVWLAAWARPAATRDAAIAALTIAPAARLASVARRLAGHATIGALLLRAGRAAEAIPFLERAAQSCDGFRAPAAHVRAAARLGEALEATGDRVGACAAYQLVLRRWGAADVPSVTGRGARRRFAVLGCDRRS